MRTLIVDDNFTNRLLLQEILKLYGTTHIAVNGLEAVEAFKSALEQNEPYDLICLDVMMPEMDGHTALDMIRKIEEEIGLHSTSGVKIIMTTALSDLQNIQDAFSSLCDSYLVKPINKGRLIDELKKMKLIPL